MLRYCANLKAIRYAYESTTLNGIVADKSHRVIVALGYDYTMRFIAPILLYWSTFQFFWGVSGSENRDGGDNSIQFINIGRVGDKNFKEWRRKVGRWKGQYFDLLCYWLDKKKMPL